MNSLRLQQRGAGIVEVFVALLVIAIGTLSAAKMQTIGMQDAQNTYHQTQANLLISEMMDRMRSNPEGVADDEYLNVTTKSVSKPTCTDSCNSEQQAQLDVYAWSTHFNPTDKTPGLMPVLPVDDSGNPAFATIAADVDGGLYLSVSWFDRLGGESGLQTVSSRFNY